MRNGVVPTNFRWITSEQVGVTVIERVRSADGTPIALERIADDPDAVGAGLFQVRPEP